MKKILYINILFILLLSACGQKSQEIEKKTKANNAREQKAYAEALRIAVLPTLDCIPLYVAKDRHLFDSAQVDVRLLPFTAQMDCDTAIIGGSCPRGSVGFGSDGETQTKRFEIRISHYHTVAVAVDK